MTFLFVLYQSFLGIFFKPFARFDSTKGLLGFENLQNGWLSCYSYYDDEFELSEEKKKCSEMVNAFFLFTF